MRRKVVFLQAKKWFTAVLFFASLGVCLLLAEFVLRLADFEFKLFPARIEFCEQ